MKKINTGILAIMLMSAGFAASAANTQNNQSPRHHMGEHPNMVYSVAQQTTTPNETLKKLVSDAPKSADGKRYMVKVSIVEVPEYKKTNRGTMPHANNTPAAVAPATTPTAQ